jgi:hypothetical protein
MRQVAPRPLSVAPSGQACRLRWLSTIYRPNWRAVCGKPGMAGHEALNRQGWGVGGRE